MLLLAMAALAAAPLPTGLKSDPSICPKTTSHVARGSERSLQPQRLTDLPDANVYSAVYRRVDGCEVPIVVKYRVSGR